MALNSAKEINSAVEINYDFIAKWTSETRFYKFVDGLEKHIKRNLQRDNIKTRPSVSHGLWCCFLLPVILVHNTYLHNVSLLYKIMTCLSLGLLSYSILFIVFMSVSCLVLKKNIRSGSFASSLVSTLLLYQVLDQGLIFSLIVSVSSVYMFSTLLRISLTRLPETFTIGEAMITAQSCVLLSVVLLFRIFLRCGDAAHNDLNFIIDVNAVMFISAGMIIISLHTPKTKPKDIKELRNVLGIGLVLSLCLLHIGVGIDSMKRIVYFMLLNNTRIKLVSFWAAMTALAGITLYYRTYLNVKATTVTRKVFHVLASSVFLTGIIYDVPLMTFAAGFGFVALVMIEAIRKANIKFVSPILQDAFDVYRDEKDAGDFAMSALYLYAGLAGPLILVPVHKNYELELLSGVLSVGVGDTAASWFGAKYGFNKWADGNKSMEGTLFNFMSQIAAVYTLDFFGLLVTNTGLFRAIIAAFISSMVEAKTEQNDNLIIPLVALLSFQLSKIIFRAD